MPADTTHQRVPLPMPDPDLSSLRLALFTDTYLPQVNGVARTLGRLTDAVRARGGIVRVFTTADPDAASLDAVDHAQITRVPSRAFWAYPQLQLAWPSSRTIDDALREFRPTLIHAATEFGVGLAGRRAARRSGVPFVSSYHTNFTAYAGHYGLGWLSAPGWHYLRWFHNAGLRTYCPTAAIAREITARGFARCTVWSRGVDSERFSPHYRSAAFRARVGANDDTLLVTYVGRIALEKSVSVAIDAMRFALDARPDALRFVFVGDGPYLDTARKTAPNGSTFTGKLDGDALSEAFASSDLLIFPSTTDTFGNVMIEAMASGVPVIAADVGPSREIIRRDAGWLAPAGAAEAFADIIVSVCDDRSLLAHARRMARALALDSSWDAIWQRLFTDYLALHAPPVAAPTPEPADGVLV
jgi:phosphatidylinositol alpha 1,6-mannosyltransferase